MTPKVTAEAKMAATMTATTVVAEITADILSLNAGGVSAHAGYLSYHSGRENPEPASTRRPSPTAIGGEGQKDRIGWNTGNRRFEASSPAKPPGKLRLRRPGSLRPVGAADRPPRFHAGADGRKGHPLPPPEQPTDEDH